MVVQDGFPSQVQRREQSRIFSLHESPEKRKGWLRCRLQVLQAPPGLLASWLPETGIAVADIGFKREEEEPVGVSNQLGDARYQM